MTYLHLFYSGTAVLAFGHNGPIKVFPVKMGQLFATRSGSRIFLRGGHKPPLLESKLLKKTSLQRNLCNIMVNKETAGGHDLETSIFGALKAVQDECKVDGDVSIGGHKSVRIELSKQA